MSSPRACRPAVSRPRLAAVVLLGIESVVLLGLGVLLVVRGFGTGIDDVGRAETGGVLALVGAAGLGLVTWGVLRGRSAFRSPAVVTQILCLPVAWGLLQGGLYGYGVPLVAVPILIIVLLGIGGGYGPGDAGPPGGAGDTGREGRPGGRADDEPGSRRPSPPRRS